MTPPSRRDGIPGRDSFRSVHPVRPDYSGTFNGAGHVLSNLKISNSGASADVGLFGYTSGATMSNIGLIGANVSGSGTSAEVGALIGYMASGSVAGAYATGAVRPATTAAV